HFANPQETVRITDNVGKRRHSSECSGVCDKRRGKTRANEEPLTLILSPQADEAASVSCQQYTAEIITRLGFRGLPVQFFEWGRVPRPMAHHYAYDPPLPSQGRGLR